MEEFKLGNNKYKLNNDIQTDIEIVNYYLTDDEYNDAIGKIVFDDGNLKTIFFKDMDENLIKKAIEHFIPDELRGEAYDEKKIELIVNDEIENENGYYSFFAEALTTIVLKQMFKFEPLRATIGYGNSTKVTSQGADSVLYDDVTKTIVMAESKFYKNFSQGVSSIVDSINNKGKKISDLFQAIRSSESGIDITVYGKIVNGKKRNSISDSGLLKFGEMKNLKKIIVGFILHENQSSYKNNLSKFERKSGFFLNGHFGIVDRFYLIHLPIDKKSDFICDIIKLAMRSVDG